MRLLGARGQAGARRVHREPFVPPAEEEGYRGPALLVVGEAEYAVDVHLADHVEPLDGLVHWYGRIRRDDAVVAAKDAGATTARLVVDGVAAEVRLAEYDAWGNVAVRATGRPPYAGVG